MPRVTLQDYLNQIDRLIDENRLAEAATHCRHILQQYPRHVETYRILGRVLLEQQKYSEAVDVFVRVASADPEDMITQAGLAFAYKESLDLPKAIWHMERAFELDPYNRAIQEELLELYAARDGVTYERMELNRAALARLYFNSAMYSKASAELYRLLSENPNRLDLQILLADALFWDGGPSDLVEVCLRIVEEMPYCIKANAILAAAWMRAGRPMEAEEHWRRVQSLTLMTNRSVDPDSTLGKALRVADGLEFPQEVVVEDLDELAATARQGDALAKSAVQSEGDPATDEQVPGWLHEIGFTDEDEMETNQQQDLAFQSVPEPIEDGWLDEVALAAGLGVALDESEPVDDDAVLDQTPLANELDSEQTVSDTAEMDADVYELLEDELGAIAAGAVASESEFAEDAEAEIFDLADPFPEDLNQLDEVMTVDDEAKIEDVAGGLSDENIGSFTDDLTSEKILDQDTDTSLWQASGLPKEEDRVPVKEDELQEDLTDLVEELESRRKGKTALLPDLDQTIDQKKKGSDWLDDLADDSSVSEDLPEWLYESVGFTEQLYESPEDESAKGKERTPLVDGEIGLTENVSQSEDELLNIEEADLMEQQSSSPAFEASRKDDDLPDWLLNADEVLEELPEDVIQEGADSWLQGSIDEDENVRWLDELVPGNEAKRKRPSKPDQEVLEEGEQATFPNSSAEGSSENGDVLPWLSPADDELEGDSSDKEPDDGG